MEICTMEIENNENKIVIAIANNIALESENNNKEIEQCDMKIDAEIKSETTFKRVDTLPICSICLEQIESNKYITQCKHIFHTSCFAQFIVKNYHKSTLYCPNCNREFKNILFKDAQIQSVCINIQNDTNLNQTQNNQGRNHNNNQDRNHNNNQDRNHNRVRSSRHIDEHTDCSCQRKNYCFILFIVFIIIAIILIITKGV